MDFNAFTTMMAPYVDKAASAISQMASQYGPAAADLALYYVRIEILSKMVMGIWFLGVIGVVLFGAKKIKAFNTKKLAETDNMDRHSYKGCRADWYFGRAAATVAQWIGSVLIILVLAHMLTPWKIIGLIKPEIYIIHKAFEAATAK